MPSRFGGTGCARLANLLRGALATELDEAGPASVMSRAQTAEGSGAGADWLLEYMKEAV